MKTTAYEWRNKGYQRVHNVGIRCTPLMGIALVACVVFPSRMPSFVPLALLVLAGIDAVVVFTASWLDSRVGRLADTLGR